MNYDKKYKVIIKRPDEQYGHVTNISMRLENLQKTVGGYIEHIMIEDFHIICNEEGKLLDLEPNVPIPGDWICGTIIIVGIDGEEFTSIPEGTFKKWKEYLIGEYL